MSMVNNQLQMTIQAVVDVVMEQGDSSTDSSKVNGNTAPKLA